MSLANTNAVLGGSCLGRGVVEANGLSGVDGEVGVGCWGSTMASDGGGCSGRGQDGVLTADSG